MSADYLISTFGGLIALVAIFTLILWTFLPFEVFGMKKRLDRIARRQQRTNELIEHIAATLEELPKKRDDE